MPDYAQIAAFLLGNGPVPEAKADDEGINIAMTGPRVVGGPEPPQLSLAQAQQQLPQARLLPDQNVSAYQPPVTTPMNMIKAAGAIGSEPTSAFLGSLIDKPGQLRPAAGAAWQALKELPAKVFDREQQFRSPSEELRKRGVDVGGATGLFTDLALDPLNNPLDLGKIGLLGAMALPGGAKKVAALARQEAKFTKLIEKAAPEVQTLLTDLRQKYPNMALQMAQHGTEASIPLGRNRGLSGALDSVSKWVHDITLAKGGASMQPLTGGKVNPGDPAGGFIVGKYSNQSGKTMAVPFGKFTTGTVKKFIEHNAEALAKDPNLYVGAWHDKDTGNVYLDVSEKFDDRRKAVLSGMYQKQPPTETRSATGQWPKAQKAIYDVAQDTVPDVGNFYEFVNSPDFQQRLDEMHKIGTGVMNGKDWWDLHGTDLERVYGKENVKELAGFLASTSPASAPVHNLRTASEYMRRYLKKEPIIQPNFIIPETSVGWREGTMGAMAPGDFNSPGKMMPMESTRAPNLERVAKGLVVQPTTEAERALQLRQDKVNDMFHALMGEKVGVYDRRYAKLAEDWDKGVYAEKTADKLAGSMDSGNVSTYAILENSLRDAAKRAGEDVDHYTAAVWEGIGDEIKRTGQLYGMKHGAEKIPEASLGFPGIFQRMVEEKAKIWGISVAEFEKRLRNGDAELLAAILSTPIGWGLYRQSRQPGQARPATPGRQPMS